MICYYVTRLPPFHMPDAWCPAVSISHHGTSLSLLPCCHVVLPPSSFIGYQLLKIPVDGFTVFSPIGWYSLRDQEYIFKYTLYKMWLSTHILESDYPHSWWASLVAQMVKNLPAMQETWVWSLSQEDPLKKGMATHFHILSRRLPWTEEPVRLQPMGLQRVWHDWATNTQNTIPNFLNLILWFTPFYP